MTGLTKARVIAAVTGLLTCMPTWAADSVKVAFMTALSGPFANVGEAQLSHAQFAVDQINARGGVLHERKLQLVPMDDKNSPQEALLLLKQAVDQGIQVVAYCCGSHIAPPLSQAVETHNSRNPDRRILLLVVMGDQAITNEACSFWTFAFFARAEMLANALATYVSRQPDIKRVFLINQDYAWGHQNQRFFRQFLARMRPDITIVGDDLIPMGKVKDFAPYVTKVRAAKADAILTANWGNDMVQLIKATNQMGYSISLYTYWAMLDGAPIAMGDSAVDKVKAVFRWHPNLDNESELLAMREFKRRYRLEYQALPSANMFGMLARAMDTTGSADPLHLAFALEDMHWQGNLGEVWMRADDHQLFEPLYILTLTAVNGRDVRHGFADSNIGTRTDARLDASETLVPTSCRMRRPPRP